MLLAAWGPCGYSPVAPGTAGTIGAIPLFWALHTLPPWLYLYTVIAFIALASHAAGAAGRYWKHADASPITIDEVVGYLVTMALVPWGWGNALAGFLLFRFFDVLKPWPAGALDRKLKNGFGVVMDDVAAGLWSWGALYLLRMSVHAWASGMAARACWLELFP